LEFRLSEYGSRTNNADGAFGNAQRSHCAMWRKSLVFSNANWWQSSELQHESENFLLGLRSKYDRIQHQRQHLDNAHHDPIRKLRYSGK